MTAERKAWLRRYWAMWAQFARQSGEISSANLADAARERFEEKERKGPNESGRKRR